MSFNFAPRDWAQCNGQFLPINQNQALFSLLGTTFGGNGQTTFALPDLRGRVPIHVGPGYTLGERGGEQAHTLSIAELPDAHARRAGDQRHRRHAAAAPGNLLADSPSQLYRAPGRADDAEPRHGHERRRQPGAPEHAAVPGADVLHRADQRHLPEPELRRQRPWHSPTSARSACSRATSPRRVEFCEGQQLPISENETLFQLIGTTYGGDGESTFNLPDLRGRLPIHQGNGFILGRDRRGRGDHADGQPDPGSQPSAAGQHRGRQPVVAGRQRARPVDRRRPLHRGHGDRGARADRRSAPSAAASRTRTSSRTCASTSSSRCSASSRSPT